MPQVRTLMFNAIGRALLVFNVLGLDVVVRCVDFGGIIDYHCLNFLFIALILLLLFFLEFEVECQVNRLIKYSVRQPFTVSNHVLFRNVAFSGDIKMKVK